MLTDLPNKAQLKNLCQSLAMLDAIIEPEWDFRYSSFCLWHLDLESVWKTGNIEYPENDEMADGSGWLLFLLDGKPETYCDWAIDYYERDFDIEIIEKVYRHESLTEEIIKALNPQRSLADLREDAEEIGYPLL